MQRSINTRIFGNKITAGSRGCHVERDTTNIPHYSNMRQKFSLIHLLKNLGNHPVILHEVKHALYIEEPRFYIPAFCSFSNVGTVPAKCPYKQCCKHFTPPEGGPHKNTKLGF
jgi:hypothetical protein